MAGKAYGCIYVSAKLVIYAEFSAKILDKVANFTFMV